MTFHHRISNHLTLANLLDSQGQLLHLTNVVLHPAFAHVPESTDPGIIVPEKFAPRRQEHERKLVNVFMVRMQQTVSQKRKILEPEHQGRIFGLYIGYLFAKQQQKQEIRSRKRFKTIKRTFLRDLYNQFENHALSQSVYKVDYNVEAMLTGATNEYESWLKTLSPRLFFHH